MLSKEEYIHTFRQGPVGVLIGADWKRSDLLKAFQEYQPELSGEQATAMKHGLVFIDEFGAVFVETAFEHKSEEA